MCDQSLERDLVPVLRNMVRRSAPERCFNEAGLLTSSLAPMGVAASPTKIRIVARCAAAGRARHDEHHDDVARRRSQIWKCRAATDCQLELMRAESGRQNSRQPAGQQPVERMVTSADGASFNPNPKPSAPVQHVTVPPGFLLMVVGTIARISGGAVR